MIVMESECPKTLATLGQDDLSGAYSWLIFQDKKKKVCPHFSDNLNSFSNGKHVCQPGTSVLGTFTNKKTIVKTIEILNFAVVTATLIGINHGTLKQGNPSHKLISVLQP